MMGVSKEVGQFPAANLRRITFHDVKSPGSKRSDDFVKYVADFNLDDRLTKIVDGFRKKMHVFVFFRRVLTKSHGQFFGRGEVALKIIANALRITLAAAIQVKHPAVR